MTQLSSQRVRQDSPVEPKSFNRHVLKLDHAANIGPIGHIICWIGCMAFAMFYPGAANWWLAAPLIVLLTLLSFSLTIGILHMHTHRPLFSSRRPNRVVDALCCMPAFLTAAEMREVHILSHHRFDDGPGDITSTLGHENGLRALWYWIRYGTIVKMHTIRKLFASEVTKNRRKRRHQFIFDTTLTTAITAAMFCVVSSERFVIFYAIPLLLTHLCSGYFAWLSHAPARKFEDGPSQSINTAGNLLNFFIFNQGYHSVHHRYPGIHWSEIPDRLEYMTQVAPDVIVPYWMTINSAWRLIAPHRFLNAPYGERWKQKLEKRIAEGTVRSRYLPWFAWI